MESKNMTCWRSAARTDFFDGHESIEEIARKTGVSRQSVSAYLKKLPGYREERERRKAQNALSRKDYKRQKNREYRAMGAVTAETIRREHDVAALILSREKYH